MTTTQNGDKPNRHPGVDVLRAIAVLSVFIYHAVGPSYGYYPTWNGLFRDLSNSQNRLLLAIFPVTLGWSGVALFFVISGFCIHLSFLRNTDFSTGRFLWRRFWRIYPAYLLTVLVFAAFLRISDPAAANNRQILSHLLFLHNTDTATFFGINPSFWSLATEMQLYLLYPVLLFLRSRFGMTTALIVTAIAGLAWRAHAAARWGLPDHLVNAAWAFPLMTWFDWTLGACVAERYARGETLFGRRRLLVITFVVALVISTFYRPLTIFSFSFAAALFAVVLESALLFQWKEGRLVSGLTFVGLLSYSLYLWHQPILQELAHRSTRMTGSPVPGWIVSIPIVMLLAWITFRCIEKPGIWLGDTLWPRRRQS